MATFNKRGYKAPKPQEEKAEPVFVEEQETVEVGDSVTAKTFDALDESASKAEAFIEKNRKPLLTALVVVAALIFGYVIYDRFVVEPKEDEAATALFQVQQRFQKAIESDGPKADSLFTLVLKGNRDGQSAIEIADQFSGTASANLAHFYAGIASLNLGKYDDAIQELEAFKTDEQFMGATRLGNLGDAYSEKKDYNKALDYYKQAADFKPNDFTTPRFLLKAGKVAMSLNQKAEAHKLFQRIKDEFELSPEAQTIDGLLSLTE